MDGCVPHLDVGICDRRHAYLDVPVKQLFALFFAHCDDRLEMLIVYVEGEKYAQAP